MYAHVNVNGHMYLHVNMYLSSCLCTWVSMSCSYSCEHRSVHMYERLFYVCMCKFKCMYARMHAWYTLHVLHPWMYACWTWRVCQCVYLYWFVYVPVCMYLGAYVGR